MIRLLQSDRDFRLLWIGEAISVFGSQLTYVALPLTALALGGSAFEAGVVAFAGNAARSVVMLPGGALADLCSLRGLMIACQLARFLVFGVLGIMLALGNAGLAVLAFVAVANGALAVIYSPATDVVLTRVISAADMPRAISLTQRREFGASVLGPPIGGALTGVALAAPFVVDSATFVVSAVMVMLMSRRAFPPTGRAERLTGSRWMAMRDGILLVAADSRLRDTAWYLAILNLINSAVVFGLILSLSDAGKSGFLVGLLVAVPTMAALVGSMLSERSLARASASRVTLGVGTLWAATCVLMAVTNSWPIAAAMLALVWLVTPMMQMAMRNYRLVAVDPSVVGRVANSTGFLSTVTSPFGPLLSGLMFSTVGAGWAFAIYGVLAVAAVLLASSTGGFRGRNWTAANSTASGAVAL